MLIAITLQLESDKPVRLPPYLGRANYAATLSRLGELDADFVQALHDSDKPKPLTCSGILNARGSRQGTRIESGQPYYVRVTGLTEQISVLLQQSLLTQTPAVWELDHHCFRVAAAVCDAAEDNWSGVADYQALATESILVPDRTARTVTLRFATPTAFRSKEMQMPIPLPSLVFGSLVDRWNTFSPVALSAEMRRFAEECIAISKYRLQSRPVVQKNGALRMGGVGEVTYRALNGDRYWLWRDTHTGRLCTFCWCWGADDDGNGPDAPNSLIEIQEEQQ